MEIAQTLKLDSLDLQFQVLITLIISIATPPPRTPHAPFLSEIRAMLMLHGKVLRFHWKGSGHTQYWELPDSPRIRHLTQSPSPYPLVLCQLDTSWNHSWGTGERGHSIEKCHYKTWR